MNLKVLITGKKTLFVAIYCEGCQLDLCSDHIAMYTNIKLFHCMTSTNITLIGQLYLNKIINKS